VQFEGRREEKCIAESAERSILRKKRRKMLFFVSRGEGLTNVKTRQKGIFDRI
jgi:hypothetical protein